jgi:threonyl-tRNA synthetase
LERFMGVMIEHFAGNFPLWLAPEQVRIIPVMDKVGEYVDTVYKTLQDAGLRVSIDNSDDSFAKKVRNAETDKVFYALIIGEQEVTDGTVSVRNIRTKEQSVEVVAEFAARAQGECESRKL